MQAALRSFQVKGSCDTDLGCAQHAANRRQKKMVGQMIPMVSAIQSASLPNPLVAASAVEAFTTSSIVVLLPALAVKRPTTPPPLPPPRTT